ncbi:MAG: hypothetical protein AAGA09_08130 [Pseudomonadota bacterium]
MISSILIIAIWLGAGALLITAALSPIETLSWWAGWSEDDIDEAQKKPLSPPQARAPAHDATPRPYIVYLSGIASISGSLLVPREKKFLLALKTALPEAIVIDDVFPYSPAGVPLLKSPRIFDQLWRLIQRLKVHKRGKMLGVLINMRNVFQVLVSADHRYGPIYNHGAALVIESALIRAGYTPGAGAPITIIGYSGGGQIAVGAATFLTNRLGAPVDVLSVGGVIASGPGLSAVRRLRRIIGKRDRVQKLGAIFFPERWPGFSLSEWNIAKKAGKISVRRMEDVMHAGARGYFGLPKFRGVSNNARTLALAVEFIQPQPPLPASS